MSSFPNAPKSAPVAVVIIAGAVRAEWDRRLSDPGSPPRVNAGEDGRAVQPVGRGHRSGDCRRTAAPAATVRFAEPSMVSAPLPSTVRFAVASLAIQTSHPASTSPAMLGSLNVRLFDPVSRMVLPRSPAKMV